MTDYVLQPLGYLETCFTEKFGIPRQSLLVPNAKGILLLEKPFNNKDCIEGLENVSHVWLSFIFHQHVHKPWQAKVRPPRLGGNKKLGVFATRSSFRPNALGLSVVKLDNIVVNNENICLYFSGVDLLDGTPIVDIKPYVPYVDHVPEAYNQWAPNSPELLHVCFESQALDQLDKLAKPQRNQLKQLIIEVLQQDPRPAYHASDSQRRYGTVLMEHNVRWKYITNLQGQENIIVIDIEFKQRGN